MKRIGPAILIGLGVLIGSCKESAFTSDTKLNVPFKKEGTVTIFKSGTDSLIKRLDVEFAETEYETQTGLMYRDQMKTNEGMLFIFANEQPRYFYMKNTRMALDIIYVSTNKKIVSITKNAKPFDETSLPSIEPARYVLEINGGLAEQWQLKPDDYIEFTKL